MTSAELLADAFSRIKESLHDAVDDLTTDELAARLDGDANSIAWLAWHLTRIQDDHVAGVAGTEQVYTSSGWFERFDLPFGPREHGYGHSSEQVEAVRCDAETALGYYDEVHQQTLRLLRGLSDADLDRVVDENWDPPVTLGVRLVSVVNDDTQHVGQIAFIKGILRRR
jgi:uncharacterized damage-inducible protein DinB